MGTQLENQPTRSHSPWVAGYSVLAGPVLWFAHFFLVWAIVEFGCRANFNNVIYMTPESARIVVILLTVVALALVAVGGVISLRVYQDLSRGKGDESFTGQRQEFVYVLGMAFSALFIVSIIFTAVPTFIVDVCHWAT